jgi:hypothetical protein
LDELLTGVEPEAERFAGFMLGWYVSGANKADAKMERIWKKLKHAREFWA